MRRISTAIIILLCCSCAFGLSADPLEVGVGARALGMGRAFVAISDNFLFNPAGMKNLSLLSMSGTLLQDVNYMVVGAANRFPFGSLGFGYVASGVNSIPVTRVVGATVETYGSADYRNNILIGAYSFPLKAIGFLSRYRFIEDTSIGINLKYYTQGFSGLPGSWAGAEGSGSDLDLGLFYQPDTSFTLGLNLQNILPSSMGGKFTWKRNNIEEGIPAVLKVGGAVKVLNRKLVVAIDGDWYLTQSRPLTWHAGMEFWPVEIFALRFGIDQQSSMVQVFNNLTVGVGLKFRGFTFDYAYHQYGDISENATSYFSLGYVGEEREIAKKQEEMKEEVRPKIKVVTFKDVAVDYWAKNAIELLATAKVIGGYPDGTFRPDKELTRAELCTLLVKAKGLPAVKPERKIFLDLPSDHWAATYVKAAVDSGLVGGYPDSTFRPTKPLTRAEAIKILALFDGLGLEKVEMKPYEDIALNHWAASYIQAAKKAGILDYLKNKKFNPNKNLTRAEAAEMISKTSFGKEKIESLGIKK